MGGATDRVLSHPVGTHGTKAVRIRAAACPIPCVPGGKVVDRRAGQSRGPTRARRAVGAIPVQCLIGRWRFIDAIGSGESDIEAVLDTLARARWNLHRLQNPADLHVNFRQGHPQAADPGAFLADPRRAVERFRRNPQEEGTMGVVGGLAGSTPVKSLAAGFCRNFIDWMYRVD